MIRKTEFNYATGVNKKFIYSGYQYAITATGGFSLKEQSQNVKVNPIENIGKFNVSNSVQILLSNQLFNSKLGPFNVVSNSYNVDAVTITATEFSKAIVESQINSVGKFETIYADFAQYVDEFLNFEEGFSSIYYMEEPLKMNSGEFTSAELFNLITKQTSNTYGTYNEIFGNINIYGVNNLLSNAKKMNIFGNRANTDNIADGFLEGDIIFIPYGIDITLTLELDANNLRLNDTGRANIERMNKLYDYDDGTMSQTTVANIYRIQRNIKMPLFIKLINVGLPDSASFMTKSLTEFTKILNKTKPPPFSLSTSESLVQNRHSVTESLVQNRHSVTESLVQKNIKSQSKSSSLENIKVVDSSSTHKVVSSDEMDKKRNFKLLTSKGSMPEQLMMPHMSIAPHLGLEHNPNSENGEINGVPIMQQTRARIPLPSASSTEKYNGIVHKKRINITNQFI